MVRNAIETPHHVVVVGAGPSGCLLAMLLADQGACVTIYEGRPDQRYLRDKALDQRSINISLSTRGTTALERIGLADIVKKMSVPMYGRCIHRADTEYGVTSMHPYGQPGQCLLAVSRTRLAHLLQSAAEEHKAVKIKFAHKCTAVDLKKFVVTFENQVTGEELTVKPNLIVGADGAFSRVRNAMARQSGFDFSQEYNPLLYKELSFIPPSHSDTYNPNALHVWPRHEFMLMTQPDWNPEVNNSGSAAIKTHTATLFMPPKMFEGLDTDEKIIKFMIKNFPDAIPAMPDIARDFSLNPTAPLLTVRCKPYNAGGRVVLIGDAAHAVVPFYGQGCNAALEDSCILADLISVYGWNNLEKALDEYSNRRKKDADAIANLAIDNYHDMSKRTVSTFFVVKKRLEIWINRMFPSVLTPLYGLVSFSTIPYSQAVQRARLQDKAIFTVMGITTLLAIATIAAGLVFVMSLFSSLVDLHL